MQRRMVLEWFTNTLDKLNDMDLIGIPIRITVGKKVVDDKVEIKLRKETYSTDIDIDDIISKTKELIRNN